MATVTINHNPRSSKRRQTLALLEDEGVEPRVVEYLNEPPSEADLRELLKKLGKPASEIAIREIVENIQGPYFLAKCLHNEDICNVANCPIKLLLEKAQSAIVEVFSNHSIADLLKWQRKAETLLDV